MPVRYLLDTNTASYVTKGNYPRVRERLLKVPMAEVGISVVTEAELRFGVARLAHAPSLKVAVEEFLLHVEVLPWDSNCALHYANLRAEVERRGEPMGNLDMMIAAQALALGVTLVTNDRVFRRVKGLKVEDWSESIWCVAIRARSLRSLTPQRQNRRCGVQNARAFGMTPSFISRDLRGLEARGLGRSTPDPSAR